MMGNGFGGGWMWLFALLALTGLVLLVTILVRVVAGGLTPGPPPRQNADQSSAQPGRAREILDERYARGELTTEEYQERLRALDEQ